jgi:thioredoxin-related protein
MNGENLMFKVILLFLFFVGCEPANVDFTKTSDSGDVEDIIEFDNCGYEVGFHTCNFTFLNEDAEEVSLYDFYGQTIVLDFSTMWCYYCQQAAYDIPAALELFENDDIVYVTILVENWTGDDPSQEDLIEWVNHFGLSSPVIAAPREEIIDVNSEIGFNISSWPTFFFIDKEMMMNSYIRGYNQEMVNIAIANAL